jgi:ferredoxin
VSERVTPVLCCGVAEIRLLFSVSQEGAAMRVVVNYALCESNAVCVGVAPEIFEVREDDLLYVLDEHPPESFRIAVQDAVRLCPKQAISIEEDQ